MLVPLADGDLQLETESLLLNSQREQGGRKNEHLGL